MIGIFLALLSAVTHATWNSLAKRLSNYGMLAMWVALLPSIAMIIAAAPLLSPTGFAGMIPDATTLWTGLVSTVIHACYFLTLTTSYRHHDVSLVYPMSRAVAPTLVGVGGAMALSQQPSPLVWVALLSMGGAVWLLASSSDDTDGADLRGRLWGLGLGCTIAAYTVWDGWSIVHKGVDPFVYFMVLTVAQAIGMSIGITITMRSKLPLAWEIIQKHPRTVLIIAALMPVSYVSALYAVQYAPVAVVAAVRGSSVVWVTLAAAVFLSERITRKRAIGVAAALAAITLIALA